MQVVVGLASHARIPCKWCISWFAYNVGGVEVQVWVVVIFHHPREVIVSSTMFDLLSFSQQKKKQLPLARGCTRVSASTFHLLSQARRAFICIFPLLSCRFAARVCSAPCVYVGAACQSCKTSRCWAGLGEASLRGCISAPQDVPPRRWSRRRIAWS